MIVGFKFLVTLLHNKNYVGEVSRTIVVYISYICPGLGYIYQTYNYMYVLRNHISNKV